MDNLINNKWPIYIWGAAKTGMQALEYCQRQQYDVQGFIDKQMFEWGGGGVKTILSPKMFFDKIKHANIIIAIKFPAEVLQQIPAGYHIYIYDGRNPDVPLLYRVENGEICIPEYMDKRYGELEEYASHYKKVSKTEYGRFLTALRIVRKYNTDTRICELGCGSGQLANMLFDNGYLNYIGVDFSAKAIELAKNANPDFEGRFIRDDVFVFLNEIPQGKDTLYIIFEVLEHVQRDVELINMLPTGCMVLLSVPSFRSFNHLRTFDSRNEIEERYPMLRCKEYITLPASEINVAAVFHMMLAERR